MEGLSAVFHVFPARRQTIKELALADETFRSLCADFAAAETSLRRFAEGSFASEDRRNEYARLVNELSAEIVEALDNHDCRHQQNEEAKG